MRTTSKHLFTVWRSGKVAATYRQAASVAKYLSDPAITDGEYITVDIARDNRVMNLAFIMPDTQILDRLREAVAQLDAACHVA